jgi:hypothetical protein
MDSRGLVAFVVTVHLPALLAALAAACLAVLIGLLLKKRGVAVGAVAVVVAATAYFGLCLFFGVRPFDGEMISLW